MSCQPTCWTKKNKKKKNTNYKQIFIKSILPTRFLFSGILACVIFTWGPVSPSQKTFRSYPALMPPGPVLYDVIYLFVTCCWPPRHPLLLAALPQTPFLGSWGLSVRSAPSLLLTRNVREPALLVPHGFSAAFVHSASSGGPRGQPDRCALTDLCLCMVSGLGLNLPKR